MTHQLPIALRDHDSARSLRALTRYYHGDGSRPSFTGRHFDTWPQPDLYRFTSEDIVAVTFLSVDVPANLVPDLVQDPTGRLSDLLRDCPEDLTLAEVSPETIVPEWAPWRLWGELYDRRGLGRTKTSKLLARKRPHLIPVWDTVVGDVVGPSLGFWQWLQQALTEDGLQAHLKDLRADAGLPENLPVLRVFDVIAWMQGKRYDLA